RAWLVHAGVDGATEMLQERAEQASIQIGFDARLIDHGAGRSAARLRVADAAQPGPGGQRGARLAERQQEVATRERKAHGLLRGVACVDCRVVWRNVSADYRCRAADVNGTRRMVRTVYVCASSRISRNWFTGTLWKVC